MQSDWPACYEALAGRAPRPFFVKALARFDGPNNGDSRPQAIELGCGDGTETLALLTAGWRVLSIDSQPSAVARVEANVPEGLRPQVTTRVAPFQGLSLPPADFVYAGYSLPFCPPAHFDRLWSTIVHCLRPGGRFAGQLFGVEDSWADDPEMTFHSAAQVEQLLAQGLEVEWNEEIIDDDSGAVSGPKRWHVFNVVGRKSA